MYCSHCGAQLDDRAVICIKCGVPTNLYQPNQHGYGYQDPSLIGYDWLTVLLLCFFLGTFGVHNFYTKKTTYGVLQLITLGGCGIWVLIDFIMILLGSYTDGYGRPLNRR